MPREAGAWHDRRVPHRRTVIPVLPNEIATRDGLAYSLWIPTAGTIHGGVVILHGAGSCKESHHDFARALLPPGLAALSFDQRGHGASESPMDARALADIAAMVSLLRERIGLDKPIALRGSSMGGYLALIAAGAVHAQAVVAICPASASGLQRGLDAGTLRFDADVEALARLLGEHDLQDAVSALDIPVLLLHAEGDEQVPVQHSRELEPHLAHPASRLIVVPGGHHRSIQHDEELQAVSLRFLERSLTQ
jgi:alpha-beta hydrolase superfamily lysophospholipase